MKRRLSIDLATALLLATGACADVIFDVSFESPQQTVNTAVATGVGPFLPSGAESVTIRTGIADFSSQVASFEPAGAMSFYSSSPSANGIVMLSWDFAAISFGAPGLEPTVSIQTSPSGSGYIYMDYSSTGDIEINSATVASFAYGVSHHVAFQIDLDAHTFAASINGTPVFSSTVPTSYDVQNVVFGRHFLTEPNYAVDNFRWETIPEPSTLALLALTGFGIALRARRSRIDIPR